MTDRRNTRFRGLSRLPGMSLLFAKGAIVAAAAVVTKTFRDTPLPSACRLAWLVSAERLKMLRPERALYPRRPTNESPRVAVLPCFAPKKKSTK